MRARVFAISRLMTADKSSRLSITPTTRARPSNTSRRISKFKEQLEKGEKRMMDCIDCHNRPTHAFELPENAVDQRMSRGIVSPELPFMRKKAVELLKVDYPNRDTAKTRIVEGVNTFYRTSYPELYNT